MSKKSSARTGSEGDADSTVTDVFSNICSGSSSCKSKRDLEGGPFGDSPCERNQEIFKDYFILMFRDDDTTTNSSEGSEVDEELYNLQNDYLEKLNIVRRRLNLIEISDKVGSKNQEGVYSRCKITEIENEETYSIDSTQSSRNSQQSSLDQVESYRTESNDEQTTRIFPLSFSAPSLPSTDVFEADYNPPKKKVCYRLKTPKLPSTSEGNVPYYRKVSLREDLFKEERHPKGKSHDEPTNLKQENTTNKFIDSKETQCSENDFISKVDSKEQAYGLDHLYCTTLYPEVIIERKTENIDSSSSCSLSSKKSNSILNVDEDKDKEEVEPCRMLSLNAIRDNLEDSATTTYRTTIDSPHQKKTVKRWFGKRNKVSSSEKLTLWEEIRKLYTVRCSDDTINMVSEAVNVEIKSNYNDEVIKTCNSSAIGSRSTECAGKLPENFVCNKVNCGDYFDQYLKYKREIQHVKPRYLPFGGNMASRYRGYRNSVNNFCYSEHSVHGDEEKKSRGVDTNEGNWHVKHFWENICCCWSGHSSSS